MKLPYCLSCSEPGPLLYRRSDGRFQVMGKEGISPLMIGFQYVLAEPELAEYLDALDLPRLSVVEAVLYDAAQKTEHRTHKLLQVGQRFSPDMIHDIDIDGERILLMGQENLFVSPNLKRRLEAAAFPYLRFSEGLREFAGSRT